MEESYEDLQQKYLIYINTLINNFKIIEVIDFRMKVANLVKTLNEKTDIKKWNEQFFNLIIDSSSLSVDEITNKMSGEYSLLMTMAMNEMEKES